MIRDVLAGKTEQIVAKSVRRFTRNTVDSLTTIRRLKEVDCECFFQTGKIMTLDSKGELLIIMFSLAQEESSSIAENVTWGQRKQFSAGKVSIPYGQFLGYSKGARTSEDCPVESGDYQTHLPKVPPQEIYQHYHRRTDERRNPNAG